MANRRQRRVRRQRRSHRKIQPARGIIEGADFINSMPDEILHRILSFMPTDLAIRTSVLSRRWRHVWCETPCLYINTYQLKAGVINQTLTSYMAAPIITSFDLVVERDHHTAAQVNSWIEFAISRNVQNLSVTILDVSYSFPDFFYLSSSVNQLTVTLNFCDMIPRCRVSWKSLRILSLCCCKLPDESIDNILSGCPILESLRLYACPLLERLDLSKSPSLRRLDIDRKITPSSGPIVIVAPHIHYLRLTYSFPPFNTPYRVVRSAPAPVEINLGATEWIYSYSMTPSTLVDVSSLTEANLNIITDTLYPSEADLFQTNALEMLAKLHNVERLTVGETLLQILSLAELRGVPFPMLKVQTLIVNTEFVRSIIPGITRLLQNSPGLKKLTLHTMHSHDITDMHFMQGLYPDQCWRSIYEVFPTSKEIYKMLGCNDATTKLLGSFMELVLRNAKTLERMVLWLGGSYFNDAQWFEQLLQMVGTLSHNSNVSILLKGRNLPSTLETDRSSSNIQQNPSSM